MGGGEDLAPALTVTVCCPNWTRRTQRQATAELYQDREDSPSNFPVSEKKFVKYSRLQLDAPMLQRSLG